MAYNKCDKQSPLASQNDGFAISAKQNINIDKLKQAIVDMFISNKIDGSSTIITNQRHAEAIKVAINELETGIEASSGEKINGLINATETVASQPIMIKRE